MDVAIERCAGLHVYKKTVTACVRTASGRGGARRRRVRTFATTNPVLQGLESGWSRAE